MARYVVNGDWPANVAPALTPSMTNTPKSSFWGWSNVVGAPGTQAVASPKPGVHSISPSVVNQPSWCSPDVIYPSLYRSDPDFRWRHIPVRPMNVMPVPATNLYNMAGIAMRSRRTGGRYQVAQPGVAQVWPDLLGRIGLRGSPGGGGPLPPRGQ